MKIFFIISILAISFGVQAKNVKDFNQMLMEKVQKDIRNDNDHDLKVKTNISRGPASVAPSQIEEDKKIDKMNIRKIGPNRW